MFYLFIYFWRNHTLGFKEWDTLREEKYIFFFFSSYHALFLFEGPGEACCFRGVYRWTDLFHAGIVFLCFWANIEKPFPALPALHVSRMHGAMNLVKHPLGHQRGMWGQGMGASPKSHLQNTYMFSPPRRINSSRGFVPAHCDFVNEHPVHPWPGREHRAGIVGVWE